MIKQDWKNSVKDQEANHELVLDLSTSSSCVDILIVYRHNYHIIDRATKHDEFYLGEDPKNFLYLGEDQNQFFPNFITFF